MKRAYPDTLVGTDSHTTMVNGLGVLGWGVGGIEAEAAMLGQPVTMLIPQVIGFRLTGCLPAGATATDLVLTVTEMLRKKGVVDKFVEFFGDGLAALPLADRATIANMSPEFGSTCAIFPIDEETIRYLELTARPADQIALVEAYAKAQGMWRTNGMREADYTDVLDLDLATVEPSLAGPKRPQDRVPLRVMKETYRKHLALACAERLATMPGATGTATVTSDGKTFELKDGAVLIAAITSCTNTSNPAVLIARRPAGAQCTQAWPSIEAVGQDEPRARFARRHRLPAEGRPCSPNSKASASTRWVTAARRASAIRARCVPRSLRPCASADLVAASVLSGNRNFEGRVHPEVKMNFLASPPLVVAYALAGTTDIDMNAEPIGTDDERPAGVPEGHLADTARDPADHRCGGRLGNVPQELRERLHGRRALAGDPGAEGRGLPVAGHVDLRA